jgi:hypothetical protein
VSAHGGPSPVFGLAIGFQRPDGHTSIVGANRTTPADAHTRKLLQVACTLMPDS